METSSFRWKKEGRVFQASGQFEWMQSHAQCPTVLVLPDRLRIYYTSRPKPNTAGKYVSYTSFIEVDKHDPRRTLYVHDRPILPLGGPGAFDQFGVMPGCVVRADSEVRLYYVGWMRSEGVPYDAAIGLAISNDGGVTFRRYSRGPLFGKSPSEPFLQGSSTVLWHKDRFHMWYLSGTEWIDDGKNFEPVYVLMHAESSDGISWLREGNACIPSKVPHECQASPTVLYRDGRWNLWFSYRWGSDFRNPERGYRIGYAWSKDLSNWHRDDDANDLRPSESGWDSEMICYPCVVDIDGVLHMFYSGNGFGREGFGFATASGGRLS